MLEYLWIELCRVQDVGQFDFLDEFAVLFHLSSNRYKSILNDRGAERCVVIIDSILRRRLSLNKFEFILTVKYTISLCAKPEFCFLTFGSCQIDYKRIEAYDG